MYLLENVREKRHEVCAYQGHIVSQLPLAVVTLCDLCPKTKACFVVREQFQEIAVNERRLFALVNGVVKLQHFPA